MSQLNKTHIILLSALIASPASVYASSWSCSSGNNVREIHIKRPTSSPVPCEVVYKKLTEGVEAQVLWSAKNDDSYCDEKAEGLVEKLDASGWVCTETIIDDADNASGTTSQ